MTHESPERAVMAYFSLLVSVRPMTRHAGTEGFPLDPPEGNRYSKGPSSYPQRAFEADGADRGKGQRAWLAGF
jgi:hypothetical protein